MQGNGLNSPRMGQQHSKQLSPQMQQPQSSALQAPSTVTSAPEALPAPSAATLQALLEHLRQKPLAQQPNDPQSLAGSLSGHVAPKAASKPGAAVQGIGSVRSPAAHQNGGVAAQQPAHNGRRPAAEPRVTVDWCQPPAIGVQYEDDLSPGQGAASCERLTQQTHRASQVRRS